MEGPRQSRRLREVSNTPLVLLTVDAPARGAGAAALKHLIGAEKPIHAVIEILQEWG